METSDETGKITDCANCGAGRVWFAEWRGYTRCLHCHTLIGSPPAHSRRDWFGCVTCWSRIKPGKQATIVTDMLPQTAITTGGV